MPSEIRSTLVSLSTESVAAQILFKLCVDMTSSLEASRDKGWHYRFQLQLMTRTDRNLPLCSPLTIPHRALDAVFAWHPTQCSSKALIECTSSETFIDIPVTRCAQPQESFCAQGGILTWSDTTGECGIPCLKESLLYEADVDVLR